MNDIDSSQPSATPASSTSDADTQARELLAGYVSVVNQKRSALPFAREAALKAICDGNLAESEGMSFPRFCQARLKISKTRAYELIAAAEVFAALSTLKDVGPPKNERQLRPIAKLPADLWVRAWRRAVASAGGRKVTGASAKIVVAELLKAASRGKSPPATPTVASVSHSHPTQMAETLPPTGSPVPPDNLTRWQRLTTDAKQAVAASRAGFIGIFGARLWRWSAQANDREGSTAAAAPTGVARAASMSKSS